jgi:hypothetical protein
LSACIVEYLLPQVGGDLRLQLQVGLRVVLCSKQVLLHGFQPISPLDFDMLHHAVVRFKL